MERMGSNIHVRIRDKKSKTEAIFFSSRKTVQIWIEDNKKSSIPCTFLLLTDPDAPKYIYRLKRYKSY